MCASIILATGLIEQHKITLNHKKTKHLLLSALDTIRKTEKLLRMFISVCLASSHLQINSSYRKHSSLVWSHEDEALRMSQKAIVPSLEPDAKSSAREPKEFAVVVVTTTITTAHEYV